MSNGERERWGATYTYVGPSHRLFEYLSGWQVAFTRGMVFFLIVHEPVGLAPFDSWHGYDLLMLRIESSIRSCRLTYDGS